MESVVLYSLVAIVHAVTGAIWLGAMCYSFFLLHPRAKSFFGAPADFEVFIATVSQGARWKVLGALGVLAVTGIGLAWLRWPATGSPRWFILIGCKVVLLLVALVLFIHVSWRLWPARVLAIESEIPHFQRAFAHVAMIMLTVATLGMVLGILAHTW